MTGRSTTSVTLRWTAAAGGPTGYGVYTDGTFVLNVSRGLHHPDRPRVRPLVHLQRRRLRRRRPLRPDLDLGLDRPLREQRRGRLVAAARADVLPPTAPLGLVKSSSTQTSIAVSWTASSDNIGVAGYGLYRNGSTTGSSLVASASFSGLACGTTYTLAVDAYDAAGNRSGKTSLSAATSACAGGGDTAAPHARNADEDGLDDDVDLGLVGCVHGQCRRRRLRPLPERLLDRNERLDEHDVQRPRLRLELRPRGRCVRRRRQPQRPAGR